MDLLDKAEEEAITLAAAVPTKSPPLSRISQIRLNTDFESGRSHSDHH